MFTRIVQIFLWVMVISISLVSFVWAHYEERIWELRDNKENNLQVQRNSQATVERCKIANHQIDGAIGELQRLDILETKAEKKAAEEAEAEDE